MIYQLQYWNEAHAEWRGAGYTGFYLEPVKDKMRNARVLCGDTLRFRIIQTSGDHSVVA